MPGTKNSGLMSGLDELLELLELDGRPSSELDDDESLEELELLEEELEDGLSAEPLELLEPDWKISLPSDG